MAIMELIEQTTTVTYNNTVYMRVQTPDSVIWYWEDKEGYAETAKDRWIDVIDEKLVKQLEKSYQHWFED